MWNGAPSPASSSQGSEGVPVDKGTPGLSSVVEVAFDGGKGGAANGTVGGRESGVAVGVTVTKSVSVAVPRSTLTVAMTVGAEFEVMV